MAKTLLSMALLTLLMISSPADDKPAAPVAPASPPAVPPPPPPSPPVPKPTGNVWAPSNDVGMGSDGKVQDQDSYQVRIGELHAPGGESYIIPLRMPVLPEGKHLASVHLRTQLASINNEANGLASADLYALGVRDTNAALPTDYYQGSKPDQKATLLQANFLTPASKVRTDPNTGPFIETTAEGDAALAKYINEAISKPGNAGKFILLRVSYDVDPIPNGNSAYLLLTTGANGDNEPPIFTYTLK